VPSIEIENRLKLMSDEMAASLKLYKSRNDEN